MTIKKFEGKTKEEAINAAKRELGQEVVIMNIKEAKGKGILGVFRKPTYEVTAAVEEEEVKKQIEPKEVPLSDTENSIPSDAASLRLKKDAPEEKQSSFSAAADEEIPVSSFSGNTGHLPDLTAPSTGAGWQQADPIASVNPDDLRSAFKEINDVIDRAERVRENDTNYSRPVIKRDEYTPDDNHYLDRSAEYINEREEVRRPDYSTSSAPRYSDADRPQYSSYSAASQRETPQYSSYSAASQYSDDTFSPRSDRSEAGYYDRPDTGFSGDNEDDTEVTNETERELLLKYEKNHEFIKTLYNILLAHEVDEVYINRIIAGMGNIIRSDNSLDFLIANVYQKIVLLLGNPDPIEIPENPMKRPQIVFFTGPTGVGKTTTIAKIASDFKIKRRNEVAFITTDTYRIAATEQLKVYADILKVPMKIAYTPDDVSAGIEAFKDKDLILVDTVGFSHKNKEQKNNLSEFLNQIPQSRDAKVYLVLSTTTKYSDIKEIIDSYRELTDFNIIFTKLDETDNYGNILNARLYSGKSLSYVTMGQNVPDDISLIDVQALTKTLLGGN